MMETANSTSASSEDSGVDFSTSSGPRYLIKKLVEYLQQYTMHRMVLDILYQWVPIGIHIQDIHSLIEKEQKRLQASSIS